MIYLPSNITIIIIANNNHNDLPITQIDKHSTSKITNMNRWPEITHLCGKVTIFNYGLICFFYLKF